MLNSVKTFSYLSQKSGVTNDGEKYIALEVRDKEDKKNYNFITKDLDLIDKIANFKFIDFQDIKLKLGFERNYNQQTRYSHWDVVIVDLL